MKPASERARGFVRWTLGHARIIWTVALIVAVPSVWRTVMLYANLRSDFEELLPKDAPSVVALDELRARMPGLQHLGVVVDIGSPENLPAAERFLDDLAARIRKYPKELVSDVRTGSEEEHAFLEDKGPLYVSLPDLRVIRERVEARRDWEVSRMSGTSLDEDEPAPKLDFSDIEKKYGFEAHKSEASHRFASADKHVALLLVEVGTSKLNASRARQLLNRVKDDERALGGLDKYAPGMKVGYSAEVATSVEETDALEADLSTSSVFVIVAVGLVIAVYFEWAASLVVLIVPLLLATVYAFAAASLPPFHVTTLNSNTAFLGSIIVGNGINFAIVLLARYVEERRGGAPIEDAMTTAVHSTAPATLTAALAAGSSYAALSFTRFQGFRQFGCVGGLGMVFAWAVAFVLVPSLAARLDHGLVAKRARFDLMKLVARAVSRGFVVLTVLWVVFTVAAAWKARGFDSSWIETDVAKLRRADTWTSGEGYWGARMNDLLGEYLTPIAVLTDSPEQAEAVASALRDKAAEPGLTAMISRVRTLSDVVPTEQPQKIAELDQIREDLTPRVRASLTEDQRKEVDRFVGSEKLAAFGIDDVPHALTLGLRDRSGSARPKTVLVYPVLSKRLWEGHALERFVDELRKTATQASATVGGPPPRVAGSQPLTADILSAVEHDGPRITALAFFLVVIVVVVLFRFNTITLHVVVGLASAVLWMLAATMALGLKVNFVNFIAFPITFGIGVDYPVNVAMRLERDHDVATAVRATGGAVTLCSLTTILGYSSLLVARNRGLELFGLYAVLGEIACLSIAVLFLPSARLSLASLFARLRSRG